MIASGTGRNRHAFWPLTEPLAADEVERGNRRLAHALGADPASADAARILRVPATYSHKHQPPVPVDALRLDIEQRMHAADVVGGLPDPPQAPRTTSHPPVPAGRRGDDPLLSIEPAVYVQRLLSVEVPRHRKVACPFHPDRHPSLHVYDTAERGAGTASGAASAAARSTTSPPRCTATTARGKDFLRLRAELRKLFGLEPA